jgi:hypothetical protein
MRGEHLCQKVTCDARENVEIAQDSPVGWKPLLGGFFAFTALPLSFSFFRHQFLPYGTIFLSPSTS